jgi:hypothetical protein
MGGQAHLKHAREMGMKCCWTKIRRGFRRQRRKSVFVKTIVICEEVRVYKICNCCVFCCVSDYIMAGSMFLLESGFIKG